MGEADLRAGLWLVTTLIWHFVVLVGSSAILLTGVALFVALVYDPDAAKLEPGSRDFIRVLSVLLVALAFGLVNTLS